jgi:hypothetical protein
MDGIYLGKTLLERILPLLPRFILKRFAKPNDLLRDFEIDLAGSGSFQIQLSGPVPQVEMTIRVTNKTVVPITVDRVLFEVWIGQPILEGAMIRRVTINPKGTTNIYSRFFLNELQKAAVKHYTDPAGRLTQTVTLNIEIFCDSQIGPLAVDRKHFQINPQTVPVN